MDIPHSFYIWNVMYGFREMGAEIVPYHLIDDIYEIVTKIDIVLDYIEQCNIILQNMVLFHIYRIILKLLKIIFRKKNLKDTINSISCNEKRGLPGILLNQQEVKCLL